MALVTEFLTNIRGFLLENNGDKLREWLRVDQTVPAQYFNLSQELQTGFRNTKAIDQLIERSLPEEDDVPEGHGSPWPGFVSFMKDYMQYWREADFQDPVRCYELLSSLVTSCATALSHPTYGSILFQTSISLSDALSKLVMMLHWRPELTSQLKVKSGDEENKSIVESAADTIQKIFTTCLTDRSSTRWDKPRGKKVGVYIFANLVLKLLFTCRKSRLAVQMFTNIDASGPALALFPASQRVTYLYYLGRFSFENNSFQRAARCLEAAYFQTPPAFQKHRRLILTYLIPSNILLGRLPSNALLLRPEAAPTLRPVFAPLAAALRAGNFVAFQAVLKAHEHWLFARGQLITLGYRLRPLLWRSLSRRTFLLTYVPPPPDPVDSNNTAPAEKRRGPIPTLDLADLAAAASFQQKLLEGYVPAHPAPRPRAPHTNALFMKAVRNSAPAGGASTLAPPPGGPRRLRPSEGVLHGNLPVDGPEVEATVASLVAQGLLHGYVAHAAAKFAVVGAKQKPSAVVAGWPPAAAAIQARLNEAGDGGDDVPAWVVRS